MKVIKEELESSNWIWFKAFEKRLLVNLLRAQDFLITWRASVCSIEFWNLSWLWTSFLMKICSLRIRFAVGQGARRKLMSWVSSRVPKRYMEKSFPHCFKDGILLCALTEKLVPGACPRYDLLDPDQPLRNLKLALHLVTKQVKIKPVITADEILKGDKFSEKRLLLLVAQMKLASEKFNLSANSQKIHKDYLSQTTFVSEKCFARGMGLLLAVSGRKACFTILLDSTDNLDMVIEIRGPRNTACNKRITNALSLSRSESTEIRDINDAQIQEDILSKRIPLAYRILGRKITVNYTPLESGTHHMSIIWQGQHIMGSPYTITVDSSVECPDIWNLTPRRGYCRLRRTDSQYYDESIEYGNESSLASCPESEGTITRKRILRYIVRIEGNDVVIDGREDLCKAINCITKQDQNTSSDSDENCESQYQEGSDSFTKSDSEGIKNNFNEIDCISCPEYGTSFEHDIKTDSPVLVSETDKDISTDSECKDPQLLNSVKIDASECSNNKTVMKSKDIDIHENKNIELNSEVKKMDFYSDKQPNKDFEISDVSESSVKERNESKASDISSVKSDSNQRSNLTKEHRLENKPKFKVSFSDETIVQSDSTFGPSDFSNNNSNPDNKYLSPPSDDINFFPVHKVEYETLHDGDDDDIEDPNNCNQKRRRSFTELNESNYLDEDIVEIEVVDNELGDNLNSLEAEKEDSQNRSGFEYQSEVKDYDAADIRNCLRANHSLFQCDHSLSLFTETVVETPPEFAPLENDEPESVYDSNVSDTLDNEMIELKDDDPSVFDYGKPLELEKWKSSGSINLEYVENDSSLTTFNEFKDFDPFSSQDGDLNKFDEFNDEFDQNKKSNLQDFPESRRRLSWCDRDHLPCIRESSIEGLLDSEANDDKIRNREISENSSCFSETKIKSKPAPQLITISPTRSQNITKLDEGFETPLPYISNKEFQPFSENSVDRFNNTDTNVETKKKALGRKEETSQKNVSLIDASKSAFSSMNILSASPYKNRDQSSKHSEVKFSTITNSEKLPTQNTSTNQSVSLSVSQNTSDTFILTYAKPAVVEECQNLIEKTVNERSKLIQEEFKENILDKNSRDVDYSDSREQKSAQCLSVKKVIQIFQKEKEEPVDIWPGETEKSPYYRKKCKDDNLTTKIDEKSNSPESENCLFTPFVEISRSSIKDRVKLFENDERNTAPIRKYNNVEKRASSSISAKKNYWESITS